jgi:PAS domain-containing protein
MMDELGFVTFMNPAAEKLTGFKFEEFANKLTLFVLGSFLQSSFLLTPA